MHPTPLEELSPQQVIVRYADMVYRLLYAQLCNPYDAQDAFQEVFLAYMPKAPVFASEEHRKACLIRVSINQCKTFWRCAKREKSLPVQAPFKVEQEPFSPLLEALGALNPKQRALIHLFLF